MSLFVQSSFSVQERYSNKEMQLALDKSRKRHTITKQDLKLTAFCSALDFSSVNHFARIRWGKAFCREFEEFFEPITSIHRRIMWIVAVVFFFELGDLNTFAFAAPAVMKQWDLSVSIISSHARPMRSSER